MVKEKPEELTIEEFKVPASIISMLARATKGLTIESEEIISKFTNIKDLKERTRFPTFPMLAFILYAYSLYDLDHYVFEPYKDSADTLMKLMVSYKGQSRAEMVEMAKVTIAGEAQQFYIGEARRQEQQQKKGFLSRFRKPKQEESEFAHK